MNQSKFAVVDIFGRQFKVSEGDIVQANYVEANASEQLVFPDVFMVKNGDTLQIGAPTVKGAKINAEVVEHGREDKILVFKYLRKNKSKKMHGHRQPFTKLRITSIEV